MELTTTAVFLNTVVLELLNKYNYDDWVEMVQTYLISQDLWDAVDPGIPVDAVQELEAVDPVIPIDVVQELNADHDRVAETSMVVKGKTSEASDDDKLKRDKKNAAALHAIKISCGQDALYAIRGIVSARKAWTTLARKFRPHYILELPDFQGEKGRSIEYYVNFFQAIEKSDWKTAQVLYKKNPDLLKATYKSANYTALHFAVRSKENEEIVEDMVERMSKEDLEIKESSCGWTALAQAMESGTTRMVECMIQKNNSLLVIADNVGVIPVILALYKRMDLVPTLYSATPKDVLLREGGKHGATIISTCIKLEKPETIAIALNLIRYEPRLAIARDNSGKSPAYTLACATVLFRELRFWEQWIYDFANKISAPGDSKEKKSGLGHEDDGFGFTGPPTESGITSTYSGPPVESDTSNINSGPTPLRWLVSKLVQLSGVYKRIGEQKLVHERSIKLLENMCETIRVIKDERTLRDGFVFDALFEAVDEGNIKFVKELMKANPVFAASSTDQQYILREICVRAIQSRQVDLFKHILQKVPGSQYVLQISAMPEMHGNNLLHEAARVPPSLSTREAALQMKKELQWFEEVKNLLHPTASTDKNVDNLTPGEVFTQSHKNLRIEGEKWMKDMSTSCSVIATVILTMAFAAAFTAPGEDDHKRNAELYYYFWLFDGISLFYSTASVLIFSRIIMSQFREDDFLVSLPRKLIIGQFMLFVSIASMSATFSVVLLIMLPQSWAVIFVAPAFLITLVALLQILFQSRYFRSTYRRSFL